MWLLLVAAGTGYLARCWQKARKCKSGSSVLKHNAALYMAQRSPSCTPRRGRSTTANRRGSRKRSQSARSRKILPGRSEGRFARKHARDWDDNFGSSEKFFEELLCGNDDSSRQCILSALNDQDASGQVETSSQVNILDGNNHMEPYLSLSSMSMQDQRGQTSSCMEQPLLLSAEIDAKEPLFCVCALSNKKPIFETLHGCSATTLDFVKNQLNIVASSSKNGLDCSKPTENSLIASDLKSHAPPACLQISRIKTTRESTRQNCVFKSKGSREQAVSFFAKMARELRQRTYSNFTSRFANRMGMRSCSKPGLSQNPKEVSVRQSLSFGKSWKEVPEKEKSLSLQRDKHGLNYCALHSHLLKALLDPEYLDQCHRCNDLTVSIRGNDHENAVPLLFHHAGLSMGIDKNTNQNSDVEIKANHWKHSEGQAAAFTKPPNPRTNHLLGSNERTLVALGVAMGVACVASGRNNEFEDLHKLLKQTNLLIEELKKQMDSRFEFDPVKLINVEKYDDVPIKPTMPNETCSWKAHQHSESNLGKSAAEIPSLEPLSADNNDAPNVLSENYVHGLNELEAELEAELQRMELNVCNTNLVDYEWKQTQSNEESWQPEGDDGLYVDIDMQDSMAIQDAEQLYECDFVVPPLELERRLWQVLEQRHEERICELENDLHITNEKVTAKEVEVQWWKDRVWWLMETSLGGKSDNIQPLLAE